MGTRFTTMMVKYLQRQLGTDSVTNSVEDDVDSTRHDATVPRHPLDCVRLASTGCSIGEEQLVLPLQEVPHHWSHHLPKHRGLATTWTKNLGEGVPASAVIYLKGIFYSHPSPSSKFMSAWWHFGNLAKAMSIINILDFLPVSHLSNSVHGVLEGLALFGSKKCHLPIGR